MTDTSPHTKPLFEGGLPTKITGIVFWGIVLIGTLATIMLLHGQDSAQLARHTRNGEALTREISETLEKRSTPASLQANRLTLKALAARLQQPLGFESINLSMGNEVWVWGETHRSQSVVTFMLPNPAKQAGATLPPLKATVYFPSLVKSALEQHKNILLGVGAIIIIFGLILQRILHRMLSRPFNHMVTCAQASANGDMNARFDENRSDEFGFLAQFINRALDSLTQQQQQLKATLGRATQSEAALSREKERAEVTLHSITDGVITTNASTHIQYMNPAAEQLTGWSNSEAHHLPLASVIHLVHETTGLPLPNPMVACLQNNAVETLNQNAALLRRDGERIAIETSAAPMYNDQDNVFGAVMVFQDVRHTRLLTHQLSYQASHDLLTGLFNRLKFEEGLNALLVETATNPKDHALLYLDLDQFKIVNDTSGHVAGDELLRQVSAALHTEIRSEDTLARLGGDEFGVLLRNCPLDNAIRVAEKLRHRVKDLRFAWQDKTFEIGVSIGVVAINENNLSSASILSAADLACYTAKDMGRNRIHIYEPTDATLAQRHGEMCWTTMIVDTLNENRFLLFQQAIRAIGTDTTPLDHYEILIRMLAPDGKLILPGSFIPAAERYNLMPGIDRWVIRYIFAAMANDAFGPADTKNGRMIAINLSGASLGDDGLLAFIRATRDEFDVSFSEVCFEITETVAISNLARATELIRELRALGCRFALDDFGSGLSSFAYLKNLPVDTLKIDKSFIEYIVHKKQDKSIVASIINLSHNLNLTVIAEGAETKEQVDLLRSLGCDQIQGYFYHKALPADEIEALLRAQGATRPRD